MWTQINQKYANILTANKLVIRNVSSIPADCVLNEAGTVEGRLQFHPSIIHCSSVYKEK